MVMDISDFSYEDFASTLSKARIISQKYKYTCCIPGCNEITLKHSHIVPQCVLKKYICNDKHELIQCQIDEVHPMSFIDSGELPLEKFQTFGIEKAMSMPIFCKKHDNGLFDEYEKNADGIIPTDIRFQVLQSLRAVGALRYHNLKLLVENKAKREINPFYQGGIYDEEKKAWEFLQRRYDSSIALLYNAIENNDFASYVFCCIELAPLKLAICDAIVDNSDFEELCFDENCSAPLNMLFVHLLPKGEHSYLILGYDKRHVSRRLIMLLGKWKKVLVHETDLRILYDILCHCSNNWCISPVCDERLLSALISRYSEDRMTVVFNEK